MLRRFPTFRAPLRYTSTSFCATVSSSSASSSSSSSEQQQQATPKPAQPSSSSSSSPSSSSSNEVQKITRIKPTKPISYDRAQVGKPEKWKPTSSHHVVSQERIDASLKHSPKFVEGKVIESTSTDGGQTGEIRLKRGTVIPSAEDGEGGEGLAQAARGDVSKITVTKTHIVQQSGTPSARGEVVDVDEAGVPILHRDPDVSRPESYVDHADLTDTYFELPEGFSQSHHYVEIFRENFSMFTFWSNGMLGYVYSWPALVGWPATVIGFTMFQRFAAWAGSRLKTKNMLENQATCLDGKIVLVTGASSGIGLQATLGLAQRGADVIVSTRRPIEEFWKEWEKVLPRNLSKEDREKLSRRVSPSQLDLSEYHSVRSFNDFVQDRLRMHAKAHGRMKKKVVSSGSSSSSSSGVVGEQGEEESVNNSSSSSEGNNNNETETATSSKKPAGPLGEWKLKNKKQMKKSNNNNKKQNNLGEGEDKEHDEDFAPAPLDLLVNNASMLSSEIKYNSLNVEMQLATNVLGPMFLTELLLPNVRRSAAMAATGGSHHPAGVSGRIVNVTSMSHVVVSQPALVQRELLPKNLDKEKVNMASRYALTKLLNIYYTDELARRGVRAVSVAPGGVASNFFRESMPSVAPGKYMYYPSLLVLRTPKEGANNLLFASMANEKTFIPGAFYSNCRLRQHCKSWMAVNDRERKEFIGWAKSQLPIKDWN